MDDAEAGCFEFGGLDGNGSDLDPGKPDEAGVEKADYPHKSEAVKDKGGFFQEYLGFGFMSYLGNSEADEQGGLDEINGGDGEKEC